MIKNTTPYIGKLRLKFEKYPEYTGKSKLNKIHLNLGFTKLVSRITPVQTLKGWVINPESIYAYKSQFNEIHTRDWVAFYCTLIPKEVVDRVGLQAQL